MGGRRPRRRGVVEFAAGWVVGWSIELVGVSRAFVLSRGQVNC